MADVLRIFVVGCPRSGTTLVQSLLCAHPQLTGFTESHVFDKAYNRRGKLDEVELQRRVEVFLAENNISGDLYEGLNFIALLDAVAQQRGATGWVEKTPDHVFRIPLIDSLTPDCRFIHVLRQAQGVLPSLHKASHTAGWANVKPWWECAAHWYAALRQSNRFAGQPRHAIVSYEQLTADPRKVMQGLIAFLGLPWDEAVLTNYAQQADKLISAGEHWKASASGAIENKNITPASALPWSGRVAAMLARRLKRLRPYW
ncbi:MAG: sulfotransferase [Phycisphaeraceae bacterium]|nr:sulfotransferase [Phycisphaeraceae bacterium]